MEPRGKDVSARQEKRDRESERKLVERAKSGERAAVRELIDLHKDRLFGFIWRMVRDHHEAEDVCQDAFLKAFASLNTFSTDYRFSTWLFTIAYRVCLNRLRRKRALTGADVQVSSLPLETDETPSTVLESREASELRQGIWSAVDRLTAPQRAAVLLFYRHEMSCQEISRVVQLPLATVKSHLHRARARLREMLESVSDQELHAFRNLHERAG
jgi:RNA polymerase sigma-70 factor, ECF subfamily